MVVKHQQIAFLFTQIMILEADYYYCFFFMLFLEHCYVMTSEHFYHSA